MHIIMTVPLFPAANIAGIDDLQKVSDPNKFKYFRIPKEKGVSHASLVLKDPIYAPGKSSGDKPLEKANPQFDEMMKAISDFERPIYVKNGVRA